MCLSVHIIEIKHYFIFFISFCCLHWWLFLGYWPASLLSVVLVSEYIVGVVWYIYSDVSSRTCPFPCGTSRTTISILGLGFGSKFLSLSLILVQVLVLVFCLRFFVLAFFLSLCHCFLFLSLALTLNTKSLITHHCWCDGVRFAEHMLTVHGSDGTGDLHTHQWHWQHRDSHLISLVTLWAMLITTPHRLVTLIDWGSLSTC